MTFSSTAPAGALAKAFSMAARVSPRAGSSAPILSNLILSARGGKLVVGGVNMDARIEITIDAKAMGEVTAPADKLAAIASRLDAAKPLTMQQANGQLVVTQGRSRFTLPTLPAGDVSMKMSSGVPQFDVTSDDLADALKKVEGIAESDLTTKAHLSGVFLDLQERSPCLVAASATGLAASYLNASAPDGVEQVIIPPSAFPVIYALAGMTDVLQIGATKFMLVVTAGDIRYETKVIDGSFPEWRRIVKRDEDRATTVTIAGDVLRRAIEKLAAIGQLRVVMAFGDQIEIEAQASRKGETAGADDVIDHVGMEGPPLRVTLDGDNLAWAVASLPGAASYVFAMKTALDSIAISDPARPDDVRLVMPLRG